MILRECSGPYGHGHAAHARKLHSTEPIIRKPAGGVKLDFLTTAPLGGIMWADDESDAGNRLAQSSHFRQCTRWPFCVTGTIRACSSISPVGRLPICPARRALHEIGVPRGEPLADAAAATAAALAEPLDYPPLGQSTTPVDRVVLALDRGVPEVAAVTAAVVRALADAGVDPDGISVLQDQADRDAGADDPCRLIPAALRRRITLLTHDPANRRELAYLAADEAGEAILINRALHEADVVLPIGCLRDDQSAGYFGIHGAVYPAFSDAKTLQRFRGFGSLNGRGGRRRELVADVDHVAWLLGINFTIQIVPAAGGQVMHVLAGQSDSVRRRGRELYHAAWDWPAVASGRAWWWPPSKAGPASRRGRTWAGRCTWPGASSSRAARSPSVAIWPRRPARPCNAWRANRRARRPCGTWARSGRSMPCPPPRSPMPWTATRSIC